MAQRKQFSNSQILDKKKICEISGICVTKNSSAGDNSQIHCEAIILIIAEKFSNSQILDKKKICEICEICVTKRKEEIMKKQRIIELAVKVIVAALTAFLTAIGTTSCMGRGPF